METKYGSIVIWCGVRVLSYLLWTKPRRNRYGEQIHLGRYLNIIGLTAYTSTGFNEYDEIILILETASRSQSKWKSLLSELEGANQSFSINSNFIILFAVCIIN